MSPKNTSLAAGLLALGAAGLVSVQGADQPRAAAPVSASRSAGPKSSTSVLVLTTGEVVTGTIYETDTGYEVKTGVGILPYRRSAVEGAYASLADAYAARRARTPANDPDEKLKLAQWCLTWKLRNEAEVELQELVNLSPTHALAKRMLHNVQNAPRQSSQRDDEVQRTGGEEIEPPAAMNSQVLDELRRAARENPRAAAVPVIFDLPRPLAIRRYHEFASVIHGELQNRCARCHNEQSPHAFQLIQAKSRVDLRNELLTRANLDATLRLVDPVEPRRSVLLSSAIMPHKPSNRPILSGPNDPVYQHLLVWVTGLHSPTAQPLSAPGNDVAQTSHVVPPAAAAPRAGGFGTDRSLTGPRTAPAPTLAEAPPSGNLLQDTIRPTPAGQLLPGSTAGQPRNVPPAEAFRTVSPLAGGPNAASLRTAPSMPAAPASDGGKPPAAVPGTRTIHHPVLGDIPVVDIDELDKSTARAKAQEKKAPGEPAAADARKAPVLKKDALQRFLSGRP